MLDDRPQSDHPGHTTTPRAPDPAAPAAADGPAPAAADVLATARGYVAAGLSVLPVKRDGSKEPDGAWKPFQSKPPTDAQLERMFGGATPAGIGIVNGRVSGSKELIDFDVRAAEIFAEWRELLEAEIPGLLAKLCVIRTPREPAGYHVHYRCTAVTIPGNTKLAVEPDPADPTKTVTLIETRGEGGYGVAPGSPRDVHRSGRPYVHVSGPALTNLSDLTPAERETLIRLASLFDRSATEDSSVCRGVAGDDRRPGDEFNARGPSFAELLEPHGWVMVRRRGTVEYWRRPGKDNGTSATAGYCKGKDGLDLFAVFSTNASPFPGPGAGKSCSCHSKFDVYTRLNHAGDYRAAARALAGQGYGAQPRRTAGSGNGHVKGEWGHRRGPDAEVIRVGPLTLKATFPRRTASGRLTVAVEVHRGELLLTVVTATSAPRSLADAARVVAQQDTSVSREAAGAALAKLVAVAARMADAKAEQPAGPTVREIVGDRIAEAMQLKHRTERGLWSEQYGREVTRSEFVTHTPSWLLDAAACADDAPRTATGEPVRPGLIRAVKTELEVAWSDLCISLPRAAGTTLGADTEAGRTFRQALVKLWTKTVTFEVARNPEGDVAARSSLIARVRTARAKAAAEGRERWRPVQNAFAAWWRLHVDGQGEEHLLLAMRWQLKEQIGVELPGVTDQNTLTALGERFGVFDADPKVATKLSGGQARLAVLAPNLTEELLDNPMDWEIRDAEEGVSLNNENSGVTENEGTVPGNPVQ
jgi:putative DNA primase/helicase